MSKIEVKIRELDGVKDYDGIQFSECTFIDIYIDGVCIENIDEFENSAVYWEQLHKSSERSGAYLLFTCFCGIPEDAGWDYVTVEHRDETIIWTFDRNKKSKYEFNKTNYISQIERCKGALNLSKYPLAIETSCLPTY